MKTTNARTSLRISAAWGGALTVLIGLGLWLTPGIHDWFNAFSFDLFAAHGPTPASEMLIISLDDESHHRLAQSPDRLWDRALHATLVETLISRSTRAIVFDVLFAEEWNDPKVDVHFADVLQRASGKVILAASLRPFEEAGQGGGAKVLQPIERLAAVAQWGVVEMPQDADGALRRHASFPEHTPLAWKVAEVLGVAPTDRNRQRWLNYYSPRCFRQISYWQALQPETLPPDIFSNKVVFVGRSHVITPRGRVLGDEHATPFTRWTGQLLSGVEIQATAFRNLLRRDWLEEMPATLEVTILGLCGALFGFGLSLLRPLHALAFAAAGALVVAAVAIALVWHLRVWFPSAIVFGAQLPFALAFSVVAFVLRSTQPRDIPDHTLIRCVGRGGFGEVWLARDIIGGFHAVKIVSQKNFPRDEESKNERVVRKDGPPPKSARNMAFEREFRGVQTFAPISLTHPGLVHILHVGRNELRSSFYYIMEAADDEVTGSKIDPERYVPRTLSNEIVRSGRLSVRECLQLGRQLTAALEHLHQRQMIHRDIKPANIIFVNGQPKLADVGLVRSLKGDGSDMTRVGSYGFLAPEGPTTIQADIYSLGKTLYEAATGCESSQFPELPADLSAGPEADALVQLHEILLTACETEPAERYKSAAAMQEDLLELLQNLEKASSGKV